MIEIEGNIKFEIVDNTVIASYTTPWEHMLSREITAITGTSFIFPSIYEFMVEHCYKERGVAKCSPDDKFNKEFGKKLAKDRLVKKYNRMRYLYYKQAEKIITKSLNIVSHKRFKYWMASVYPDEVSDIFVSHVLL